MNWGIRAFAWLRSSLVFIAFFYSQIGFAQTGCHQWLGTCDYYLCLDAAFSCSSNNYLSRFGYKYCHHFDTEVYSHLTSNGQAWLDRVKFCLQESIENYEQFDWSTPNTTQCRRLHRRSVSSHSNCYVQTGYCELPGNDRRKIRQVILPSLWQPDLFAEALQIFSSCGHMN